ncbi:dihydroorotase [Verrucomicrobiota bacterium]
MKTDKLIKNGRIIDPATGRDEITDLFISNGKIAAVPAEIPAAAEIIDASGKIVCPGFIDVHVHLREPGGEAQETIESGSRACAKGGFTAIVSMPNTTPVTDTPEVVKLIKQKGDEAGYIKILPSASFTKGRAGEELTDLKALKEAGTVVYTDDGSTTPETLVMEAAMKEAAALGMKIMDHAQDPHAEKKGCMHEGEYSEKFNLPGISWMAEYAMVQRDINLSKMTGCPVHIQHITSGKAINLIRESQKNGIKVTCEVTPHHIALCDADIDPENANFKMNPPLRSAWDKEQLIAGVLDGTASMFATDHAPHLTEKKALGFEKGPFGIIGAETAIGVTYTELVATGKMDLMTWVKRWTVGPAEFIDMETPSLEPGKAADVVIIDTENDWTVTEEDTVSKGKNTPFLGQKLKGRAVQTICNGKTTWAE